MIQYLKLTSFVTFIIQVKQTFSVKMLLFSFHQFKYVFLMLKRMVILIRFLSTHNICFG